MAENDPRPLTRQELAKFLPNQRAIRAFEKLFDLIPPDLIELFAQVEVASIDANTALSIAQQAMNRRAMSVDYIDFSASIYHSSVPQRAGWHSVDDTLHLHHSDGTHEPLGLSSYALAENHTGATIPKGSAVGFAGSGTDGHVKMAKFIADGSSPPLYILGMTAVDAPDSGTHGRVIVWGRLDGIDTTGTAVGEVWSVGDVLYASPTTAGALTKVKPTAPAVSIPIAAILEVGATDGAVFVRPSIEQQLYYGSFIKTVDQVPAAINTAYPITFDSAVVANGVAIGTPASRIVTANSGLYSFNTSFQLSSGSASVKNVWLWFRKNGVDIGNSAFKVSLESGNALSTPSRSLFFSLASGDYIELMWAADDTNVTLDALASTAFAPAAPACILTVEQIQQ